MENKFVSGSISQRKTQLLFSLLICFSPVVCQKENIDTILQKVAAEKDGNTRIDLIITLSNVETDPLLDMQYCQMILLHSQKNKDKILEAMALSGIGVDYRAFGNTPKSF